MAKAPIPAIDQAIDLVNRLDIEERIALMKYISASMGGPRFFTSTEVEQFVRAAVQETINQQILSTHQGVIRAH